MPPKPARPRRYELGKSVGKVRRTLPDPGQKSLKGSAHAKR